MKGETTLDSIGVDDYGRAVFCMTLDDGRRMILSHPREHLVRALALLDADAKTPRAPVPTTPKEPEHGRAE